MNFVFIALFIGIISLKFWIIFKKYQKIKRNLITFINQFQLPIQAKISFFSPNLPTLTLDRCRIIWNKQGKGRSMNHVLMVYYDFLNPVQNFYLVNKNLQNKLQNPQMKTEIEHNLLTDLPQIKKYNSFLNEVNRIQQSYGWGLLQIKENQAFYTILAEPSENQAWLHLYDIINLLKNLEKIS
jgi:hypothetical protein